MSETSSGLRAGTRDGEAPGGEPHATPARGTTAAGRPPGPRAEGDGGPRRSWAGGGGSAAGGRLAGAPLLLGLLLVACGGDGPVPPPPGPPPPPPPGASLDLELGALEALTAADEVRSFKLEAAPDAREYLVAVHSAAQGPGSFDLQLRARGPEAPGVSASVVPEASAAGAFQARALPPELARTVARDRAHMRLRENMLRELRRLNPRPASRAPVRRRAGEGAPGPRLSVAGRAPPGVGDTLKFTFAIESDLRPSCTATKQVTSLVKAVGERFVLAEDTAVSDGFGQEDWDDLNVLLDDVTFPVDSAYWGPPADIDGNDRVIVLFTAEVNKLTPRDSQTFIGGLFWPGDLAESTPISQGGCPASNEAEIVYLRAPDPEGVFSRSMDVENARRNARSVTSHEFQHLLTAEQRIILGTGDFSNLEDVWLSEGFAHIAEEVVGLKVAGLRTRRNLGIDEAAFAADATLEAFNIHHLDNYFRLNAHLEAPHLTQAFGVLEMGDLVDPGQEQSLKMRGSAWIFLRWLADRYAPATPEGIVGGSGEERLFRELSTGGPTHLTGVANILRAVGEVSGEAGLGWGDLLSEYEAALAVDDEGPETLPVATQVLTWNLRDIFRGLHEATFRGGQNPFTREYPLLPSVVAMTATTNDSTSFELNPFTARYFGLTSGDQPAPDLFVELTTSAGGDPPTSAALQVTVVRVR